MQSEKWVVLAVVCVLSGAGSASLVVPEAWAQATAPAPPAPAGDDAADEAPADEAPAAEAPADSAAPPPAADAPPTPPTPPTPPAPEASADPSAPGAPTAPLPETAADAPAAPLDAAHASGPSEELAARPYFVKGELTNFGAVRPVTRKRFAGASAGMSALPNDGDALLNTFYLTVEPQVDFHVGGRYGIRMGFGIPLQFQIADFRGAFDRCLDVAHSADEMGATDEAIAVATADCVDQEKESTIDDLGKLRSQDWDEPSDYAKVIRYFIMGGEERPFFLNVSRIHAHSVGHGPVISRYNPNLDYNTARVGATLDAYHKFIGFESMINDVVDPDVLGLLAFVRPFHTKYAENLYLSRLSFGAQISVGSDVPTRAGYEKGLFDPAADLPIPTVDEDFNMAVANSETVTILGFDVETKVLRTQNADLKIYLDVQKMLDRGSGTTLGSLLRLSFGEPATAALRVRAEAHLFSPDYLPHFFDTFYDIHKLQYLPAGYVSSQGLVYYPTKLQFLDANAGGPRRAGFYLDMTHSFLDSLTTGLTLRGSKALGGGDFAGPAFDDLGQCAWAGTALDCTGVPTIAVADPGYASLRLHLELPFRSFLQSFLTYEVFSTSLDGEALDLFSFDGDNEILFSGLRLQLLPIVFLQAEVRRFYFLQRVTNVDLVAKTLEQDGNFHSEWTFAVHLYAGLEL
jgi:hypothetical protein